MQLNSVLKVLTKSYWFDNHPVSEVGRFSVRLSQRCNMLRNTCWLDNLPISEVGHFSVRYTQH
jgi:hypothetical protein